MLGALRMLANGSSLVVQFLRPNQGRSATRGHYQLHVRSFVRISGAPLHLVGGGVGQKLSGRFEATA